MKKVVSILAIVLLCAGVSFAEFPERDITNVVVWAAGGGTDTCNRIVSAEMAKILGVNINVTNKTGGVGGSIGMSYVYNRPADGYTICGLSESCVTAGVQGGWDKKMDVWDIMIIAGSPDVLSVTPDSPYQTLEELIEAAKKEPNAIKAGASAAGSIHHLNLLALENGSGAKFNFIPYTGSAPAQTAAMTGEVTVVVTSVAEQQQLLKGGKLRPLAMLTPDAFEIAGVGDIPSAFDPYPSLSEYLPISQAIGMAVKADTPDDVKQVIFDAFQQALETEAVKKWANDSYYVISGKVGEEANAEFAKLESLFAWTLWELGAAKVNPEELGIPKP
ncbi:tripartite tricarboxylate transporter substrate binding protein [candidate division KSB3 bacterium]|uniref:Tripartite tricarboxylate transporter substrate binding protein n=1 Tax=candidate division KSB3 bacterium TaxID=2044937 RepID=A0A9D5JSH6_9BACT|nr:tripartite tricarboxylate transporter substrate binding protein [candidate division KSB3 bacterium]MBD3323209.1 tripartite tricarboxylate transporter substrate binding protein [candidate division KSB3 bacterium]